MKVKTNLRGQALVEIAVVLPVLILGTFVTVQLMFVCHNAVCLQTMALQAAKNAAAETSSSLALVDLFNSPLWGPAILSQPKLNRQVPQPWRPFYAPSRVISPGHLMEIKFSTQLFPQSILEGKIPRLSQLATAEAYQEPAVPEQE